MIKMNWFQKDKATVRNKAKNVDHDRVQVCKIMINTEKPKLILPEFKILAGLFLNVPKDSLIRGKNPVMLCLFYSSRMMF